MPQGSILSVTLFSVKINSITQCLKPGVNCSLYVDDIQVCYRSSNMIIIERQLQFYLNKLQQWEADNGFQFSKTKTVCMHICQKIYLHLDLQLDPIHNQGLRLCFRAFRTSPVESLYVDAHEPCLGARRAKLSLQYASKIKSLPKHPAHNEVFDNKYMKLFGARPGTIRTFGLRIKHFLTASNIELSDIFGNTFLFYHTTLVYQTSEDCAGFGASEKRSNRCINIPAAFHGNTRQVP